MSGQPVTSDDELEDASRYQRVCPNELTGNNKRNLGEATPSIVMPVPLAAFSCFIGEFVIFRLNLRTIRNGTTVTSLPVSSVHCSLLRLIRTGKYIDRLSLLSPLTGGCAAAAASSGPTVLHFHGQAAVDLTASDNFLQCVQAHRIHSNETPSSFQSSVCYSPEDSNLVSELAPYHASIPQAEQL